MARAIRKHATDFIAIAVLLIISLGVSYYILQNQRLRIPILQERPFELKAEFETAQAVVPGQGQTIRVAGVRVGDVQQVELDDGVGVVTFGIDRRFLPIYRDATVLMRPQTGLKDMFFQLDPGTSAAGEYAEGEAIPVSNTEPDINLDEVLATLDSDTRAYLRLLIVGGGRGLDGRDRDLGRLLGSLGPINRDFARLNRIVAQRKESLSSLVSSLGRLSTRIGEVPEDVEELFATSSVALGAIAENEPDLRRAIGELAPALGSTRQALDALGPFARELGPAMEELRPFARRLDGVNRSLARLAGDATPALRDGVRPFVRSAVRVAPDLETAARRYSRAAPDLTTVGRKINKLGNMAAFNPRGAEPPGTEGRDEGYLYWAAWLAHNGNSAFSTQDAHGVLRRIYLTMGCDQVISLLGSSPLAPIVTPVLPLVTEGICPQP